MQFLLLYYYEYLLTHVHLSHTIYYNIQALRNSKSSLLSAGGISYWEWSALVTFALPQGRFVAYSLLPAQACVGEVSLLLTWMVTDFNGDIRLNFLAHHDSPEERDDTMFSPEVLMYMCKTILNE